MHLGKTKEKANMSEIKYVQFNLLIQATNANKSSGWN